jgi:hypothetical protein
MVKGVTKRVIVVRSPDPRFFEQAVFFLREDLFRREGVSSEQVLAEANAVAEHYLRAHPPKRSRLHRLRPLLWTVLGSGLTGMIWGLTMIF